MSRSRDDGDEEVAFHAHYAYGDDEEVAVHARVSHRDLDELTTRPVRAANDEQVTSKRPRESGLDREAEVELEIAHFVWMLDVAQREQDGDDTPVTARRSA